MAQFEFLNLSDLPLIERIMEQGQILVDIYVHVPRLIKIKSSQPTGTWDANGQGPEAI